jgi:integrase
LPALQLAGDDPAAQRCLPALACDPGLDAAEPATVRAMDAWLRMFDCQYGPVFRKVTIGGTVEPPALHPNAVGLILRSRAAEAGIMSVGMERLSSHGLRAGFVREAYKPAAKDEEIIAHTHHRDLKTMRGYVLRAMLTDNPAKLLGL